MSASANENPILALLDPIDVPLQARPDRHRGLESDRAAGLLRIRPVAHDVPGTLPGEFGLQMFGVEELEQTPADVADRHAPSVGQVHGLADELVARGDLQDIPAAVSSTQVKSRVWLPSPKITGQLRRRDPGDELRDHLGAGALACSRGP